MSYVRAVHASGGRAVLVTEDDPGTDVLDALDGIVFTGGADVAPDLYGEAAHERTYTRPARDTSEMMLLRAALERDLPVLAICRGMQLMSVAYGGRLLPAPARRARARGPPAGRPAYGSHDVRFAPGSAGAAILGDRTTVNSLHHQGVASVGALVATGWAVDDEVDGAELVEVVEDPVEAVRHRRPVASGGDERLATLRRAGRRRPVATRGLAVDGRVIGRRPAVGG